MVMHDLPKYLDAAIVEACRVHERIVLEAAVRVAFAPISKLVPSRSEEFDKATLECLRLALDLDKWPVSGKDFMSAIRDVGDAIDREIDAREGMCADVRGRA
jgi:hypothetical protein